MEFKLNESEFNMKCRGELIYIIPCSKKIATFLNLYPLNLWKSKNCHLSTAETNDTQSFLQKRRTGIPVQQIALFADWHPSNRIIRDSPSKLNLYPERSTTQDIVSFRFNGGHASRTGLNRPDI